MNNYIDNATLQKHMTNAMWKKIRTIQLKYKFRTIEETIVFILGKLKVKNLFCVKSFGQDFTLTEKFELPNQVEETSGLLYYNNKIITK